jgi:hypothetical protein
MVVAPRPTFIGAMDRPAGRGTRAQSPVRAASSAFFSWFAQSRSARSASARL